MKVAKDAAAGVNRVWWDLRSDPTKDFKLRTPPTYAPEFALGPDGTRKFPTAAPMSVLMPPGTYTVKLVVDGKDVSQPQRLVVRKDPNTTGSEADIQAQTKVLMEIRDNMNVATDLINQAEALRAQLAREGDRGQTTRRARRRRRRPPTSTRGSSRSSRSCST